MAVGIAIFILVTAAIKLCDAAAASWHVFRESRRTHTEDDPDVDWGWTPAYAWAKGSRRWLESKTMSTVPLTILMDGLFRSPVMASIQGGLVLFIVGTIDGRPSKKGLSCSFPTVSSGVSGWLTVAAGIAAVLVAMTALLSLLQLIAEGRSERPQRDAGQVLFRTRGKDEQKADKGGEEEERTLGPVLVTLFTTAALFVSFASLYAAVFAMDGSALSATPCHLDWVDMIYFAASVGATVGFGDIEPTSGWLRSVATVEMLTFFAVLTIFLQALWVRGARSD